MKQPLCAQPQTAQAALQALYALERPVAYNRPEDRVEWIRRRSKLALAIQQVIATGSAANWVLKK